MICEYCDQGAQYDSVRGVSFDCPECYGSGRATCFHCGDDAEITDENGDYSCGDCLLENMADHP